MPRLEGVPVVASGGVTGRRHGDAVPEGLARIVKTARSELREDPAVHELVVEDDWIAGGLGAVWDGEAIPESARVDGPQQPVAALVVDGEGQVDHFDVVVRPDLAVRVGWVYAKAEDVEVVLVAESFEVLLR